MPPLLRAMLRGMLTPLRDAPRAYDDILLLMMMLADVDAPC